VRISERGQVTIPKDIRDRFGLTPDSEVEFVVRDGRIELVRREGSRRSRIDELYGSKTLERSTDELMKLLRE